MTLLELGRNLLNISFGFLNECNLQMNKSLLEVYFYIYTMVNAQIINAIWQNLFKSRNIFVYCTQVAQSFKIQNKN